MLRNVDTQKTNVAASANVTDDQQEVIEKESKNLPENSSAEEVSHDTIKFNTNILPIIFYDKMKIAVDQNKPDNYRQSEPPQTVSSNAFRSHDYQEDQPVVQETSIPNKNDDIRGLERFQWKDDDDEFHSATACSEVYEHEETYLTLFDKVAMNPMKISDLFPRQLQLADHSGNSSNQESFFTAECPYFYEVSKFSTVYAQRMIPPPNQSNCCSDKQVGTLEYTAKSRTYQDGRIFRIEPDGEELAEVAIKREKADLEENVDKIKVRIRLTDERNSKKPKPSVGSMRTETDMTINRSQKFSRSLADFNVKYKAIKEKIVDETKVITDGDNIKILIPLDSTNFENENNQ
ncbi:hypothetical protein WA026_010993 [Henosepilachna vigintioctopunctata]|uniref:Uncharacterized protein n=1 Tax=Henosepilachna vigintioctopunctata TaxID=420089 RepID=A0AAW1UZX6_9CUCU